MRDGGRGGREVEWEQGGRKKEGKGRKKKNTGLTCTL